MLSVIVPIYNVEEFLPKCIESILYQTYSQLEVILVDDGSTDNCPQICDNFARKDSRIQVIHKKNEGLVKARKSGLDIAKSDFIAFVDGDDWIELDMYSNLMKIAKRTNADFVDSGHFSDINGNKKIERILEKKVFELDNITKHKAFLSLLGLEHFLNINQNIWCKIFKSKVIKDSYSNVPNSMQYGEDLINILYCILKSKKVVQVNDVFYHYRYRQDSISHLKSNSLIRKELILWNYCNNIILENDRLMSQKDIDKSLFQKVYSMFEYCLSNKFDVIQYYSFPFIEKLFWKKVVIYGAGRVGKDYITQISKYEKCEIVCWIDINYKNIHLEYRNVISIDELKKKAYDIVLIAVEREEMANCIRCQLIERGVPKQKIFWCEPNTIF